MRRRRRDVERVAGAGVVDRCDLKRCLRDKHVEERPDLIGTLDGHLVGAPIDRGDIPLEERNPIELLRRVAFRDDRGVDENAPVDGQERIEHAADEIQRAVLHVAREGPPRLLDRIVFGVDLSDERDARLRAGRVDVIGHVRGDDDVLTVRDVRHVDERPGAVRHTDAQVMRLGPAVVERLLVV